jgi:hypothetical protein
VQQRIHRLRALDEGFDRLGAIEMSDRNAFDRQSALHSPRTGQYK